MLRLSLSIFFLLINSYAIDIIVPKKTINYKSILSITDLSLKKVATIPKVCKPLTLDNIQRNKYQAKHLLYKGRVICLKDVKIYKKESVVFKFGALEIEKNGKIIFENDEFIRIKRNDGKIEKIYKNGRIE